MEDTKEQGIGRGAEKRGQWMGRPGEGLPAAPGQWVSSPEQHGAQPWPQESPRTAELVLGWLGPAECRAAVGRASSAQASCTAQQHLVLHH